MPRLLFLPALGSVDLVEVLIFSLLLPLDPGGLAGQVPMGMPASLVFAMPSLVQRHVHPLPPLNATTPQLMHRHPQPLPLPREPDCAPRPWRTTPWPGGPDGPAARQ